MPSSGHGHSHSRPSTTASSAALFRSRKVKSTGDAEAAAAAGGREKMALSPALEERLQQAAVGKEEKMSYHQWMHQVGAETFRVGYHWQIQISVIFLIGNVPIHKYLYV
jgi:hypothetical protein